MDTGRVFPLVRLVDDLVEMVVLLCVTEEEEEEGRGEASVLAAAGEEQEEDEDGGAREEEVEVCEVDGLPIGEGRIGREYVRWTGVAVEVSLGGAGMRMWGDGVLPAAAFGALFAETDGAGVRGGGGEEVVGVSAGEDESRSMGLSVSRGGVGVVGVEASGVVVEI